MVSFINIEQEWTLFFRAYVSIFMRIIIMFAKGLGNYDYGVAGAMDLYNAGVKYDSYLFD